MTNRRDDDSKELREEKEWLLVEVEDLECPFKWRKNLKISIDPYIKVWVNDWCRRHCDCKEALVQEMMRASPTKLIARKCIQAMYFSLDGDHKSAIEIIEWLNKLIFTHMRDDDQKGFTYLLDSMICRIQYFSNPDTFVKERHFLLPCFKTLPRNARTTVEASKLMFCILINTPLEKQRTLIEKIVGSNPDNSEWQHIYCRILRRIRQKESDEDDIYPIILPQYTELLALEKALMLDPNNYKIRITLCQIVYSYFQGPPKWKLTLGQHRFRTNSDVCLFLNQELCFLLGQYPQSVRLLNIAGKVARHKVFRECVAEKAFNGSFIKAALKLNRKSASTNRIQGHACIYHENKKEGLTHFAIAMKCKPLIPRYTLEYLRTLAGMHEVRGANKDDYLITGIFMEKIKLGKEHEWSEWNILHMIFLNGISLWYSGRQSEAVTVWIKGHEESATFLKQFNFLRKKALEALKWTSVINCVDVLKYMCSDECRKRKKNSVTAIDVIIPAIKKCIPIGKTEANRRKWNVEKKKKSIKKERRKNR